MVILHDFFPFAEYITPDPNPVTKMFFVTLDLNSKRYTGTATSRKEAKVKCAQSVVDDLEASGEMQHLLAKKQRSQERREAKARELMQQQYPSPMKERKNPPLPKNALAKINDFCQGLDFTVVYANDPVRDDAACVSVKCQGQTYQGLGRTKKMAKLNAAEKALKGMGKWLPEDEALKQELLAADQAQQVRAQHFYVEKERMVRQGEWRGAKKFTSHQNNQQPQQQSRGRQGRGQGRGRGLGRGQGARGRGRGGNIKDSFVNFVPAHPASYPQDNHQQQAATYYSGVTVESYHQQPYNDYYQGVQQNNAPRYGDDSTWYS